MKFYDTFSGSKRLSHIDHVVSKVSGLLHRDDTGTGTLQQAFARLGLGVEATQEKMKADVLNPPELRFQGYHRKVEIADGSWKIQNRQFLRGCRVHSFTVIRLTHPPSISNKDIETFFNELQDVFEQTGVQLSFRSSMKQHLQDNIEDLDLATASLPSDVVSIA